MAFGAAAAAAACASLTARHEATPKALTAHQRLVILRQSQVWRPTDIATMDVRNGPQGPGALAPDETVTCDYVPHRFKGKSPKFQCAVGPEDEVKVKFGRNNGEVYGEVAGTRLLWALGFGADRMYPVRVVCRGCPVAFQGEPGRVPGEFVFDTAVIERKAAGEAIETYEGQGWAWRELDLVEDAAGGASRAQRDALKLLAVFLQYGDNKPEQQRLACLDKSSKRAGKDNGPDGAERGDLAQEQEEERSPADRVLCREPFMMMDDLGLTFGGVDMLNREAIGSVNFDRWSAASVWKGARGCTGNLAASISGSLHDPQISEGGRALLAKLLGDLSDAQIRGLFEVARFPLRPADPSKAGSKPAAADAWVQAFKRKRQEIVDRRCDRPYVLQETLQSRSALPTLLPKPSLSAR